MGQPSRSFGFPTAAAGPRTWSWVSRIYAAYESAANPYFGATVGRVAFRITDARFTLDGRTYQLSINNPPHHLHGGTTGLNRVVWRAESLGQPDAEVGVRLACDSPDGDQGYPGALRVQVSYLLNDQNELVIDYRASADRTTPVNLTHHSYFNLAGAGTGDVLGHVLQLNAPHYTPLDEKLLPSGKIVTVEGTPYDFRDPVAIGLRVVPDSAVADGYDLSYLVDRTGARPLDVIRVATLCEPRSGRVMQVLSDQPAIVLYTGNYLDGTLHGKGGAVYGRHAGVCLETAHLPDAVNRPEFPSIILHPGETYQQRCVYRFSTIP